MNPSSEYIVYKMHTICKTGVKGETRLFFNTPDPYRKIYASGDRQKEMCVG
jgi:hypothetical protein